MKRVGFTTVLMACLLLLAWSATWAVESTLDVSLQSGATADGSGVPIKVRGYSSLGLDISITNTATVTIQGRSYPANTYQNVPCYSRAANSTSAATAASGNLQCSVSGLLDVQAVISGCSSCTVTVNGQLTTASSYTAGGGSSGGGTSAGVYVEDTPETPGGNLVMSGSVRRDTAASSAGITGDNATINTDANGKVWTNADLTNIGGNAVSAGNGASGTGVLRVTLANDSTGIVAPVPTTSGGTSVCYITSAASTNATNCKGSAGQVYSYHVINTTATLYYLRIYNLSSSPTCSSATGFVQTIPIPASANGAGVVIPLAVGEAYGTGIGFCLTGGGSSTDNTNAATGLYVSINYK